MRVNRLKLGILSTLVFHMFCNFGLSADLDTVEPIGVWIDEGRLRAGHCPSYPDRTSCQVKTSVLLESLFKDYSDKLTEVYNDRAQSFQHGLNPQGQTPRPNFVPTEIWKSKRVNSVLASTNALANGGYWVSGEAIAGDDAFIWINQLNSAFSSQEISVSEDFNDPEKENTSLGFSNQVLAKLSIDISDQSPLLVTPRLVLNQPIDLLLPLDFKLDDECSMSLTLLAVMGTNNIRQKAFLMDHYARDTGRTYGLDSLQLTFRRNSRNIDASKCHLTIRTIPRVNCSQLDKHECQRESFGQCRWYKSTSSCEGESVKAFAPL